MYRDANLLVSDALARPPGYERPLPLQGWQLHRPGRAANTASSRIFRCNQNLSKMMFAFEQIKHIYQYRTPRTLRAFSDFFISVLPVLYGPYFAHIAMEYPTTLLYVMPVLINAEKFMDRLQAGCPAAAPGTDEASNDLGHGVGVKAAVAE